MKTVFKFLFTAGFFAASCAFAQSNYATPYTFTTIAGTPPGSADGTGSNAQFDNPYGAALDGSGNLYVSDSNNDTIRKITPDGTVTTLAGFAGRPGDADGAGSDARFDGPGGVAVDNVGNIYVADTLNDTVRKITSAGVVTTLAGAAGSGGSADGIGTAARFDGPLGVAVDAAGNVYVTDTDNDTIRKITPDGTVTTLAGSPGVDGSSDGTGGAAQFSFPAGIAVDGAGNLHVADYLSGLIRQVTPAGVVTTLVLTGSPAQLTLPHGLAVDGAGNLYVANTGADTICEITPAGAVTQLAGVAGKAGNADSNGLSGPALFNGPVGIAVDGMGKVYVADAGNDTVREVVPSALTVVTLAGNSSTFELFDGPRSVALDGAGNVYIADTNNDIIRKLTPAGVISPLAGFPGTIGRDDGTGVAAEFDNPGGVATDSAGNVYVADTGNNAIRKITPAGVVTTLAGAAFPGSADGSGAAAQFFLPQGLAVDSSGNVYVADSVNETIRKVMPAGAVTTLAGMAGQAGSEDGTGGAARFNFPSSVAVDGSGNVYVADTNNGTIRKITPAGAVTTLAGTAAHNGSADGTGAAAEFEGPSGIAVDGAGNLFVSDTGDSAIREITPDGVVTTLAGTPGQDGGVDGTGASVEFYGPVGLAVDATDTLYVADTANNTIRRGYREGRPVVMTQPQNQTVAPTGIATFTIAAMGTPAPAYQWRVSTDGGATWSNLEDGGGISGSAQATLTIDDAAAALGGNEYDCVVANTQGDVISAPVTLTVTYTFTTLAGSVNNSGSADGTGAAAQFYDPAGVAVDSAGNVYVADTQNDDIRKITPAGVVSTLAGVPSGFGSTDGTGSAARFDRPTGVALDNSGNLYVADSSNETIRKITPGGAVTTLAGAPGEEGDSDGTGSAARFNFPDAIAVDNAGNVYVTEEYNEAIRKITPAGVVTTLAGGAGDPADAAQFSFLSAVAVASDGSVYAANSVSIFKITAAGVVSTFAGQGAGGLALDGAGNLYATGSATICKITPAGVVTTLAGDGRLGSSDGTGDSAEFYQPSGIAVDSAGSLYVADTHNDTIRKGSAASGLSITVQPETQAVNSGSDVILTVETSGNSTLSYQWLFNGDPIEGATRATLSLGNVQPASGGAYQVEITDGVGQQVTSDNATLTIDSAVTAFSAQPLSQAIASGGTVVFTVGSIQTSSLAKPAGSVAMTSSDTTYAWLFNGSNLTDGNGISGSNGPQLIISGSNPSNDGDYSCEVTTGGVSVRSNAAALLVTAASDPGLATSISTRAFVGTGDNILIGGFYIVGSTSRTVLVQALGPALAPLGVSGVLQHPELSIHQSQNGSDVILYSNTGWGSSQVLLNAAATVFATPVLASGSADSELLVTLPPGGYSAEVGGADGGTGVALCAIYELP